MPKVRALDPTLAKRRALAAWIMAGLELKAMTQDDLSKKSGIAPSTLRYKLRNPESIKMDEIWKLKQIIGEPEEVANAITQAM